MAEARRVLAVLAVERPLVTVHAQHVLLDTALLVAAVLTLVAAERLLARVDALVQAKHCTEARGAYSAICGTLATNNNVIRLYAGEERTGKWSSSACSRVANSV